MKSTFDRTKTFMYRNARPLDIARWRYHFEYGALSHVLLGLSHYQNEDGGFAHALEPDSWNPNSSPIQTWVATEILKEINFDDGTHPIVQGILKYLDSSQDFDGQFWYNALASNKDFPHAPWWHTDFDSNANENYNPTASLAGFALKYAAPHSKLYARASLIAQNAVGQFITSPAVFDMHATLCFIRLFEYLEDAKISDLVDMNAFESHLKHAVNKLITQDLKSWEDQYITKPSQFFNSPQSRFYEANQDIAEYECDFILNTQYEDGSWNIPWSWADYPQEWAISKNWWKANVCIQNMIILKNYNRI